jgi:hypothetical protein
MRAGVNNTGQLSLPLITEDSFERWDKQQWVRAGEAASKVFGTAARSAFLKWISLAFGFSDGLIGLFRASSMTSARSIGISKRNEGFSLLRDKPVV